MMMTAKELLSHSYSGGATVDSNGEQKISRDNGSSRANPGAVVKVWFKEMSQSCLFLKQPAVPFAFVTISGGFT
jgi:hypothetical protein